MRLAWSYSSVTAAGEFGGDAELGETELPCCIQSGHHRLMWRGRVRRDNHWNGVVTRAGSFDRLPQRFFLTINQADPVNSVIAIPSDRNLDLEVR